MKKYVSAVIVAILSAIVFSLTIAITYHVPEAKQASNTYYSSVNELFILYMIYITVPFIVGGCISVYLMGAFRSRFTLFKNHTYLANLFAYMSGGLIIGLLYLFVLSDGNPFSSDILYGSFLMMSILCSLIYFHLYMAYTKYITRTSF